MVKYILLSTSIACILSACEMHIRERVDLELHTVAGLSEEEQLINRSEIEQNRQINVYEQEI